MDYQYFEVCIGFGPEEGNDDDWLCIRGLRMPTVLEAEQFCSADVRQHGGHVLGVYPIDRENAEGSYDFSWEPNWPIFGCSTPHA